MSIIPSLVSQLCTSLTPLRVRILFAVRGGMVMSAAAARLFKIDLVTLGRELHHLKMLRLIQAAGPERWQLTPDGKAWLRATVALVEEDAVGRVA